MEQLSAQVTPEWLSAALSDCGSLRQGSVTGAIVSDSFETPPSYHLCLSLSFSGDAAGVPKRLRLKIPKPHKIARAEREQRFYQFVAPLMDSMPLLTCYGAGRMPQSGEPYLLLEDLSATHAAVERRQPEWPEIERMTALLARLHAAWWEHPRLAEIAGDAGGAALVADLEADEGRYQELLGLLDGQLTPQQRAVFEAYLEHGRALLLRRRAGDKHQTLCHPDNHHGNFLFPRSGQGESYIIDWHGYERAYAAGDIAIFVQRCIPIEQAQRDAEVRLLYYRLLVEQGVAGYSWDCFLDDYRLGLFEVVRTILGSRRYTEWVARQLPRVMRQIEETAALALLR